MQYMNMIIYEYAALMKNTIIFVLLLLVSIKLSAEDYRINDDRTILGFYADYISAQHKTDFVNLPDCFCFPDNMTEAGGTGFALGMLYQYPLPYSLSLSWRLGYSQYSADFGRQTFDGRVQGQLIPGLSGESEMNANFGRVEFNSHLSYNPIGGLNILFGGGIGVAVFAEYNYSEKTTLNGEPYREKDSSGIMIAALAYPSLYGGVAYDIPVYSSGTKTLIVSPEIHYSVGANELFRGMFWKMNTLRAGIAIKYKIEKNKNLNEIKQIYNFDTLTVEREDVNSSYYVVGQPVVSSSERQIGSKLVTTQIFDRTDTLFIPAKIIADLVCDLAQIKLKSQLVTEAFPLLTNIFFDNHSSRLSDTYNILEPDESFIINDIEANSKILHANVLNIIGERMRQYPESKILISGYSDKTTENSDCRLATNRAQSVKKYLNKIWSIADDRLNINSRETGCAPLHSTQTTDERGFEENRRVEIKTLFKKLTLPVLKKNFNENHDMELMPLLIDISASRITDDCAAELLLIQGKRLLFRQNISTVEKIFSTKLSKSVADRIRPGSALNLILRLSDPEGRVSLDTAIIHVESTNSPREIERLSLILFKVGSSEIPAAGRKDTEIFLMKSGLSPKITIRGFTDILGSSESNKKLARARAANTAALIKEIKPDAEIISTEAPASEKFINGIYSFDSPAERFLSRTVQLEIAK